MAIILAKICSWFHKEINSCVHTKYFVFLIPNVFLNILFSDNLSPYPLKWKAVFSGKD